jgi:sterol desaturase/sphingolipid hydroxylase (fatty acid hydroxylase superfamily)
MPGVRFGRDVKTLGAAWREFRRKRSPWILAAGIVTLAAIRALVGDPSWRDAVAFAAMLTIYPFGEWAIHVYLLHLKPFRLRGRRVELATAKAHREHHEAPNDLGLILLAPIEAAGLLLLAVPFTVAIGGLIVAPIPGAEPWPALITGGLTAYVLVFLYEWTHFLIHTAYRPRSRYYKAVWRNHRLHHFKNEHYWHAITNPVSDRVLGTNPDQRDVPRSRTARTLVS